MIIKCGKCGKSEIDIPGATENTLFTCRGCNPKRSVVKRSGTSGKPTRWIWDDRIRGYRAPTAEEKSEGLTWDSESRSYRPYTAQERAATDEHFAQAHAQTETKSARERQEIEAFERELWRSTRIYGMSDDEARACFLRFQGYSLREIANEMHVSHTHVKNLVESGQMSFRKLLRKHGMRFGRREMAREALGLGPDEDRMAARHDRERLTENQDDKAPAVGARKPPMSEQEEK